MIDSMAKLARAADGIRDGGRTLTLLGVIWCATQIAEVKQRVGVIEYRMAQHSALTNKIHGFTKVGTDKVTARRNGD